MDSPLARGSNVFQNGMCLVMTDVEGSTALWEWNGHVMNVALGLHDFTLRSLLPKYFGNEVRCLRVECERYDTLSAFTILAALPARHYALRVSD